MNDPVPDDLRDRLAALPREIHPSRDLWPALHGRIATPRPRRARLADYFVPFAIAASVALAALGFWPRSGPAPADVGWSVAALAGAPRIGRDVVTTEGRWQAGQWLETDGQSRARLDVGRIGELQVEPNSRLRLVNTAEHDHRVELARGTLSAFIWAPPRLFFVETPSATAIDLGCAYTLTVDDAGAGTLHVTSGYVALEHGGRESIVPAGLMCLTRPGAGPGTPFAAAAPPELRDALARFDFAADRSALARVLAAAGDRDAITLWHLLERAPAAARAAVYDRLAGLVPPPAGITRAGVVGGDAAMRARWALELGLVPAGTKTKKLRAE
ncbi:MAG TPA: hypothetical protein VEB66_03130 [Opitutaceae bacterium]|nr:hypothetical protein [Opitutaceae bacterium]